MNIIQLNVNHIAAAQNLFAQTASERTIPFWRGSKGMSLDA